MKQVTFAEAEEKYKEILGAKLKDNPDEEKCPNGLYQWENDASRRIMDALDGDEEAQALFAHTIHYALQQNRYAGFPR